MYNMILTGLVALLFVASAQAQEVKVLPPASFQKSLQQDKGAVLLDVRTPREVAEGHLAGAINVDYNADDFRKKVATLDTTRTYYVYCGTGIRSSRAIRVMKDLGFKKIIDLDGGIKAWKAAGLPLVKKK